MYCGLRQETQEYQSNSGAVVTGSTGSPLAAGPTPTSPVRCGFTGQNYSRPTSMTYNSALDNAISRVDAVADDSASALPLATYTYLGLSTIVQQLDGNNIGLSYIQQEDRHFLTVARYVERNA